MADAEPVKYKSQEEIEQMTIGELMEKPEAVEVQQETPEQKKERAYVEMETNLSDIEKAEIAKDEKEENNVYTFLRKNYHIATERNLIKDARERANNSEEFKTEKKVVVSRKELLNDPVKKAELEKQQQKKECSNIVKEIWTRQGKDPKDMEGMQRYVNELEEARKDIVVEKEFQNESGYFPREVFFTLLLGGNKVEDIQKISTWVDFREKVKSSKEIFAEKVEQGIIKRLDAGRKTWEETRKKYIKEVAGDAIKEHKKETKKPEERFLLTVEGLRDSNGNLVESGAKENPSNELDTLRQQAHDLYDNPPPVVEVSIPEAIAPAESPVVTPEKEKADEIKRPKFNFTDADTDPAAFGEKPEEVSEVDALEKENEFGEEWDKWLQEELSQNQLDSVQSFYHKLFEATPPELTFDGVTDGQLDMYKKFLLQKIEEEKRKNSQQEENLSRGFGKEERPEDITDRVENIEPVVVAQQQEAPKTKEEEIRIGDVTDRLKRNNLVPEVGQINTGAELLTTDVELSEMTRILYKQLADVIKNDRIVKGETRHIANALRDFFRPKK